MTIWMDKHEKGNMEYIVRQECEEVTMLDDFAGDYAVAGYLIERKRWDEVAGRILDSESSLNWQLSKTVEAAEELGVTPALLLEGDLGSTLEHSRITPEQIALYLTGSAALGVHCFVSTGKRNTAQILSRLEDGTPPDVTRVRGSADSMDDAPRFIIEGVPGVGPSTAEALLSKFQSVAGVASATESELQTVDGVGPATAEKVRDALNRRSSVASLGASDD